MTKNELISLFSNGHLVEGVDFRNLINSLKGVQTPVDDVAASGKGTTFVSAITQDAEGVITVVKGTVNFSGYQDRDVQVIRNVKNVAVVGDLTINHNKGHYPTVRLMDSSKNEVNPAYYVVKHDSRDAVSISFEALDGDYTVILD